MIFFAKMGKSCKLTIKKLPSLLLGSGFAGHLVTIFADFGCNPGAKILLFIEICKFLSKKIAASVQ